MCDESKIQYIPLPQCGTGFIYFLILSKQKPYTYTGTKKFIRDKLHKHNSGYGYQKTAPAYLRQFSAISYNCDFDG